MQIFKKVSPSQSGAGSPFEGNPYTHLISEALPGMSIGWYEEHNY
jgi:hypothetical protein